MSYRFDVSMQEGEKDIVDWIKERMNNNEISPSLVFRDAMIEKKKEWDAIHSENPANLHKRVDDLKKSIRETSQKFNDFIDSKGLKNDWIDFFNSDKIKPKLSKKQKGGVTEIIEKNPEVIVQ